MTQIYNPKSEGNFALLREAAATSGKLHLQQCLACASFQHPPRHLCSRCWSADLEFVPAAGSGFLYSYVVSHVTHDPAYASQAPFATGVVELTEGPRVVGAIQQDQQSRLRIGCPVTVEVEVTDAEFPLIWVRLEEA